MLLSFENFEIVFLWQYQTASFADYAAYNATYPSPAAPPLPPHSQHYDPFTNGSGGMDPAVAAGTSAANGTITNSLSAAWSSADQLLSSIAAAQAGQHSYYPPALTGAAAQGLGSHSHHAAAAAAAASHSFLTGASHSSHPHSHSHAHHSVHATHPHHATARDFRDVAGPLQVSLFILA